MNDKPDPLNDPMSTIQCDCGRKIHPGLADTPMVHTGNGWQATADGTRCRICLVKDGWTRDYTEVQS